ncbi:MAG: glycosyltransferase [Desulfosalsimonadaceae bacterium]
MDKQRTKLVVVTSYPIHSEPVVRNRLTSYFEELSSAGWQITLVTPESGPEGRTEEALPSGLKSVKYIEPLQYDRSRFWSRGLNEIRFARRLCRAAYQIKADAYLLTIPSVFLLLFLKRRKSWINIVDVRDLVWEYLPDRPFWKKAIKKCLTAYALQSLRKSDILAISNPGEIEYLKKRVPGRYNFMVSNGIGKDQFGRLSRLTKQSRSNGVLRVTYIGNVGLAQNLKTLVYAVAGYSELEVNIIGHGTDYPNVESEINEIGATNVFLHGRVPWNEVISWYEHSDVLYAQLSKDYETAMPSKLYEYLSTGLPVVYGGLGTAAEILSDFENVELVRPDNPEELRSVLLKKAQEPELQRSEKNIAIIQDYFIREDQVKRLTNELNAIFSGYHRT